MPKNNPKLNTTIMVYVSTFDSDTVVGEVEPALRNELIQSYTNKLAKQQRYCVWKLFDYALRDCYDGGVKDFDFYVDDNGRWNSHNVIEFSFAHTNNVVAVGICNHFVGVDIEPVERFAPLVDNDSFIKRVLTENEQLVLSNTKAHERVEMLAMLWTKKESFFKLRSRSSFVPTSIDTTVKKVHSQLVIINEKQYALSVARYIPSKIEVKQVEIF